VSVRDKTCFTLKSVSTFRGALISSKSMVYLPKDGDPVGRSARRSVEFSKLTVLIGRTGFDTISSIPDFDTRSDTVFRPKSGRLYS